MSSLWFRTWEDEYSEARLRLARLQRLESDARSVVKRREIAFRQSKQEGWPDVEDRRRKLKSAYERLNACISEVMRQKTAVRHMEEGW